MKIAYLVLAHNNERHLKKLVSAIEMDNCDIYIHIDHKYKKKFSSIAEIRNIHSKYSIHWGDFSVCDAIIFLLKKAVSTGTYDYYFLISGSDYPIRSNAFISNYLANNNGTQFINMKLMPTLDKPMHRYDCYHLSGNVISILGRSTTNIINTVIRKLYLRRKLSRQYSSSKLFAGTAWWGLSHQCISYVLEFIANNPSFVSYYKHTHVPDEMFFHTIIGNSKFKKHVANTLTYTDWSKGGQHPNKISEHHLEIFRDQTQMTDNIGKNRTYLFARKFDDSSENLIKKIDEMIRLNDIKN